MNPFLPAELQRDLVLASASPRRGDLLRGLGLEFETVVSDYVEDDDGALAPPELATAHALGKASAVALARPGALVIGADTVVCVDGHRLGKPADAAAARGMLERLSGRDHEVITGLALAQHRPRCAELRTLAAHSRTGVRFRPLSAAEIDAYLDSGEPFDKAGAYGIQGLAAQFVTGIRGCYFNVMGLPLERLTRLLREWDEAAP